MARVRLPLTNLKAASMPPACIICGRPVALHVAKTFSWRPAWISMGFFISLFVCFPMAVFMFVAGILRTRRVAVECPLCERHRGYWAWRAFWLLAPLLVLVAITLTLAVLMLLRQIADSVFGYLFFGTAVTLLGWAVVAIVLYRGILKAVEITNDDITLAPVHQLFADLLRYGRRHETAAADYGWDDYDPYPRKPLAKPAEAEKKNRVTGKRTTENRE